MTSRHSSSSRSGFVGFFGRSINLRNVSSSNFIAVAENTDSDSDPIGRNSPIDEARSTRTIFADFVISSLHPFVCSSDGKGGSAPVNANTQPGRVLPTVSRLRRIFRRVKALHDVVENCWIGDFIGGLALFSLLIIGLYLGWGAGL